jgi:methyl-accepting chemotaxis protein
MLVSVLIIIFSLLLIYQIILAIFGENILEGLENAVPSPSATSTYKDYNTSDPNNPNGPLILAQQNAGNIEYLKQRITELMGLQKQVTGISTNVDALNEQVAGLVQQQATYATSIAGNKPVDISGVQSTESEYTA